MPLDYEHAARSARRHNQRRAQRNPLFAAMICLEEVAHLKTPEDVMQTIAQKKYTMALHTACYWITAATLQRQAQAVFGATACAAMEEYFRRISPAHWRTCPYHTANFWRDKLREQDSKP